MKILAIETSCDETAIAIVETNSQLSKIKVLAEPILSQIELHAQYGGVFPALAKREHAKAIIPLIQSALKEAKMIRERKKRQPLGTSITKKIEKLLAREETTAIDLVSLLEHSIISKIDAIAVTMGPGLEPALWVGINTALALSSALDIPVYPINHMEGHMYAGSIQTEIGKDGRPEITFPNISYPVVTLLISGGHTEIVLTKKAGKHTVIGKTRDDAAGECFDKVARILGIPYPGGPEISRRADIARKENVSITLEEKLPRPMISTPDYDFSFSGLKTAVLYKVQKIEHLTEDVKNRIALDFENAVTEVLVKKTMRAMHETNAQLLIVGGGVSANKNIRTHLRNEMEKIGKHIFLPNPKDATDNALMIAVTAVAHIKRGERPKKKIVASGNWSVGK